MRTRCSRSCSRSRRCSVARAAPSSAGRRTLNLDVLWADVPVQSATLSVPHPRLHEPGSRSRRCSTSRPSSSRSTAQRCATRAAEACVTPSNSRRSCRRSGARCERARSGRRNRGCARAAWPATRRSGRVCDKRRAGGTARGQRRRRCRLGCALRAALDQALRGFAWTHACVSALDPARASARLFGASAPRGANVPALLDAELTRDGDALAPGSGSPAESCWNEDIALFPVRSPES